MKAAASAAPIPTPEGVGTGERGQTLSILVSRRRVLILDTEVGCIPLKAANSLLLILRSAITTANFQRITADAQLLAMILQADVSIL